jgi:hypothetical protein
LTLPNPHAIVLPDTRPPETQRLSLCKGKAEREPAVTGGLVSSEQASHIAAARLSIPTVAVRVDGDRVPVDAEEWPR